jgi:Hint domain
MVSIFNLFKLLFIGLIFLLSSFLTTDLAYARGGGGGGGCFATGTSILTVRGNLPIEQLHKGDRIISYNFRSNQTEVSKIGDIQIVNSENIY